MDFIRGWSDGTEIVAKRMTAWIGISCSKDHDWQERYGKVNEHNAWVPRDHWVDEEEKRAILDFHGEYPLERYRRLAFMMLDRDVVAVSPSSVYRVLKEAGALRRWNRQPSKKRTGFVQPLKPHEHWHVDDGIAGLDAEGVVRAAVAGEGSLGGEAWRAEAVDADPGVQGVPECVHETSLPDRADRAADHGSMVVEERVVGGVLAAEGMGYATRAGRLTPERRWGMDAPVSAGPTRPASKSSRGDDETNTTECPQVGRRAGQRGETSWPTFRENRTHGVQGDSLVLGLGAAPIEPRT